MHFLAVETVLKNFDPFGISYFKRRARAACMVPALETFRLLNEAEARRGEERGCHFVERSLTLYMNRQMISTGNAF